MTSRQQQVFAEALTRYGITHCRVLHRGEVVLTAGAQDEPLPVHSIRKSIMSALIGRLVDAGAVGLDSTLAQLGIDDSPPLTSIERSATLEHLLKSSSGVYLPLKFESSFDVFTGTPTPWPGRGSSLPGAQFYYSNWDFNVLGEIYQRVSGTALFVAIDRLLAQPLGFRDWDPLVHTRLRYGRDIFGATERFPNYAMSLSSRDLARFGQLYCDGGHWQDQQLVPADWVQSSTRAHVTTGLPDPFGNYGYLWWVTGEHTGSPLPTGSFSAVGYGGQALTVIPSESLVIVALCENIKGRNPSMFIPGAVVSAVLSHTKNQE